MKSRVSDSVSSGLISRSVSVSLSRGTPSEAPKQESGLQDIERIQLAAAASFQDMAIEAVKNSMTLIKSDVFIVE